MSTLYIFIMFILFTSFPFVLFANPSLADELFSTTNKMVEWKITEEMPVTTTTLSTELTTASTFTFLSRFAKFIDLMTHSANNNVNTGTTATTMIVKSSNEGQPNNMKILSKDSNEVTTQKSTILDQKKDHNDEFPSVNSEKQSKQTINYNDNSSLTPLLLPTSEYLVQKQFSAPKYDTQKKLELMHSANNIKQIPSANEIQNPITYSNSLYYNIPNRNSFNPQPLQSFPLGNYSNYLIENGRSSNIFSPPNPFVAGNPFHINPTQSSATWNYETQLPANRVPIQNPFHERISNWPLNNMNLFSDRNTHNKIQRNENGLYSLPSGFNLAGLSTSNVRPNDKITTFSSTSQQQKEEQIHNPNAPMLRIGNFNLPQQQSYFGNMIPSSAQIPLQNLTQANNFLMTRSSATNGVIKFPTEIQNVALEPDYYNDIFSVGAPALPIRQFGEEKKNFKQQNNKLIPIWTNASTPYNINKLHSSVILSDLKVTDDVNENQSESDMHEKASSVLTNDEKINICSEWNQWSDCSEKCGGCGHRFRERRCSKGSEAEEKNCHLHACNYPYQICCGGRQPKFVETKLLCLLN